MHRRYSTPHQLVEALQQRGAGARTQLWQLLREPVTRMLDKLVQYGHHKQDLLILHTLHLAETWLRTRPLESFATSSWNAFRASVLVQVGKLISEPFGGEMGTQACPLPLPETPVYQNQTFFLPHERVGDYWFGGDWYAGMQMGDGSLWVIVADITGHGYRAYLLASALPGVWHACWQELGTPPREPVELLRAMHHLLSECLPEGVFVECTLVRLGSDGEVTVAPAGGSRMLLLRGGASQPDLLTLRGTWLGLLPPSSEDQRTWVLNDGDELLLSTDGMFDQLASADGTFSLHGNERKSGPLFDTFQSRLQQVLDQKPQKDDITMVLLRRRKATRGEPSGSNTQSNGSARHPSHPPSTSGAGDVSM